MCTEEKDSKWELNQKIGELKRKQSEWMKLKREVFQFEEESEWQNKRIREVNINMIEHYPNDVKLKELLIEKEQIISQKITAENKFRQECEDIVTQQQKATELLEEEYEMALRKLGQNEELI